jgi:hypothetical protein
MMVRFAILVAGASPEPSGTWPLLNFAFPLHPSCPQRSAVPSLHDTSMGLRIIRLVNSSD